MAYTVPILPCPDVDEVVAFYAHLGFRRTYRQLKPNPCVVVEREDVGIHFAGIPGFDPASSYGSCLLVVPDPEALYKAFAAGLKAAYGKVPVSGIPRMTRPRASGGGFSVVDPGGNYIRVTRDPKVAGEPADDPPPPESALARALDAAIRLGEQKGDAAAAARLLDAALANRADAPPRERFQALVYRAELGLALKDEARARAALAEARGLALEPVDRAALARDLARADELDWELG